MDSTAEVVTGHRAWRAVFFDGPFPHLNEEGEIVSSWTVYIGDRDGEPVRPPIARYLDFKTAEQMAEQQAKSYGLELIHGATLET